MQNGSSVWLAQVFRYRNRLDIPALSAITLLKTLIDIDPPTRNICSEKTSIGDE